MPDKDIEIALLRQDVDALKFLVEKQSRQLDELLIAWQTANGVLSFFKLLGGLAIAATAILGFVKGWRI